MSQAIEISNISKSFVIPTERKTTLKETVLTIFRKQKMRQFQALDNISFSINKGEFVGIIGKNGSGKSTLLKIMCGIYKSESGEISTKGRISPFLELGIGFNDEISARDNVTINATILGLSRKRIQKIYPEIVSFAGLEGFMEMKIKNFSSGMKSRLAFAIASQVEADIYLCDEVLAVGDIQFQEKCHHMFRNFKKNGKTVVLVTHDLATAENYCDRLFLIEHGKLVASGDPHQVIKRYHELTGI